MEQLPEETARVLAAERERCAKTSERQYILDTIRSAARRHPETSDVATVLRHLIADIERLH